MRKKLLIVLLFFIPLTILTILFIYETTQKNNNITSISNNEPNDINSIGGSPEPRVAAKDELNPTQENSKYTLHKHIFTTMFWVGEKATDANDYIPNESSAWDVDWLTNFGGIDNPYSRNGFFPKNFTPKENPFYFALPYDDFGEFEKKQSAFNIPWQTGSEQSALKNKWIEIIYKENICYAQWEDVGPFETDDFDYVFLGKKPKEKRAGLDISPATRTCLKMAVNDFVDWRFIDESQVPQGPWKNSITTTGVNW